MKKKDISLWSLIVLFICSIVLMFFVLKPYLISIIMAIIAANILRPWYNKVLPYFKNNTAITSLFIILVVIFILLIPCAYLLGVAIQEAGDTIAYLSEMSQHYIDNTQELPQVFKNLIGKLESYNVIEQISKVLGSIGSVMISGITSLGTMTFKAFLKIFIFLYCLFFFIPLGPKIVRQVMSYVPLSKKDTEEILSNVDKTTQATIKGTIVIGAIQGFLAGVGFWIVGIPGPVFWGCIMAFLSMIPMVGAAIIWIPTCIILALSGNIVAALILGAYCGILVGNMDNLLRPRLVGKDVGVHEILILTGTLGGIGLFGIAGFILGPTIIVLAITLGNICKDKYQQKDS